MAVEEVRVRLRRKLEGAFGAEEASYLMDRPPGGWSDLVTNPILDAKFVAVDHRFDAVEHRFDARFDVFDAKLDALENRVLAAVDRRLRAQTWVSTSTLVTGLGLAFAIARFG
ncbi:MAG: hypothetical protein ACRDWD_16210 [Acidimicrobiia bacterium]